MAKKSSAFTNALAHALSSRATAWERFLGYAVLSGILGFLASLVLVLNTSTGAGEKAYAGLEVCEDGRSADCLALVPGELDLDITRRGAPLSMTFEPDGDIRPRRIEVSDGSPVEPAQGLVRDGELVGIQDAAGTRFPLRSTAVPPVLGVLLLVSPAVALAAGLILTLSHRRATASSALERTQDS